MAKADTNTPAATETGADASAPASPLVLRSTVTGRNHRLGELREGEPVETWADGTPLTDDEKRDLNASEFLNLE